MFEIFSAQEAWIALFTLLLVEIIVSMDNIVFISFATQKLGSSAQRKALYGGIAMAILLRIVLLISFTLLLSLKKPFLVLDKDWVSGSISIQGTLLLAGGMFLVYKGTKELREKIEDRRHDEREVKRESSGSLPKALAQLFAINMVFSFDFVLSGVGLTNGITTDDCDMVFIILLAALLALFVMITFAHKLNALVERHPSIKVLGLAFMMLIGFALIADAAHVSHISLFQSPTVFLSKGFLCIVILFSTLVGLLEFLRTNTSSTPTADK